MDLYLILTKFPYSITLIISMFYLGVQSQGNVDISSCKNYTSDPIDRNGVEENKGLPLLYMGETYEKEFYITTKNFSNNFFRAALNVCPRFGLKLAQIKSNCEYGIIENWFFDHYPTDYSAWIGGIRFGLYYHPIWITTGESLDLSQFGVNVNNIGGPYQPNAYTPIQFPWINCLTVSRNCSLNKSSCNQNETYSGLQFMWDDCRHQPLRVICEKSIYPISNVKIMESDELANKDFENDY